MHLKRFRWKGEPPFEEDWVGFSEIRKINVLIGPNNCGKSRILDFIADRRGLGQHFELTFRLGGADYQNHSQEILSALYICIRDLRRSGHPLASRMESESTWHGDLTLRFEGTESNYVQLERQEHNFGSSLILTPLSGFSPVPEQVTILRIFAERGVHSITASVPTFDGGMPSQERADGIGMGYGTGVTDIVAELGRALKWGSLPTHGWYQSFLQCVNEILAPVCLLSDIEVLRVGGRHEIFVSDATRTRIPLSKCGAGIQTAIHVAVYLEVLPKKKEQPYIHYFFEELENNLHPSVQRSLMAAILKRIRSDPKCSLWMSTHSPVLLDMLLPEEDVSVTRVQNVNGVMSCAGVGTRGAKLETLLDLGVRCSEAALANGVLWVEGPTDRLYLKAALKLLDPELEEGIHFAIALFGGSLAARIGFGEEISADEFVPYSAINANYIFYCDRDRDEGEELKPHVVRIQEEATASPHRALVLVTAGREIENYTCYEDCLDIQVARTPAGLRSGNSCEPFSSFANWYHEEFGEKFTEYRKKVLAKRTSESQEKLMSMVAFGFINDIREISTHIRRWNGLEESVIELGD